MPGKQHRDPRLERRQSLRVVPAPRRRRARRDGTSGTWSLSIGQFNGGRPDLFAVKRSATNPTEVHALDGDFGSPPSPFTRSLASAPSPAALDGPSTSAEPRHRARRQTSLSPTRRRGSCALLSYDHALLRADARPRSSMFSSSR